MIDLYPVTIVEDRYTGTYSEGVYTAWNLDPWDIPKEIDGSDAECALFWRCNKIPVGKGFTPNEALDDLVQQIAKEQK